jgi:GH15 family glucan-1,4-alpha-glucosidase
MAAGRRIRFSLSYARRDIAILPPLGESVVARIGRTGERWAEWCAGLRHDGRYRAAVQRSGITLKLMTFTLSGAVVAAPTTSLPEWIGAGRNWDYRYCWLRDAALTMRAFISLGLVEEASAFLRWLLHATALTQPRLGVVYDIYGRARLTERTLDHLSGYRDSRPVRIGNDAYRQRQLDAYGSVIAAAAEYVKGGGALQSDQRKLLAGFGDQVCRGWREPDNGMWEVRGGRRHYTFSKLMCWVALDWLLKLDREIGLGIDARRVTAERDAIEEMIDSRGYDEASGCYVGELDGKALDAALLLMPCLGYKDPADPRIAGTLACIESRLGRGPLVYRYEKGSDNLGSAEGAFGLCSFWLVEALARVGEVERARDNFERLLDLANDVGLFGEEIDADTGAALGNFPQAFTHVGLINAAVAIDRAERGQA